jgi:hypothetical protein
MVLSAVSLVIPTPSRRCLGHSADNGLSASMHVHMLNRDLLLASTPELRQRLDLSNERPLQLGR